VSPALVQRQAALAAAALFATLGVLALSREGDSSTELQPTAPVVHWESAVVGVLSPRAHERQTSCGSTLDSGTIGVAHPLLPCGVDLMVALGDKRIRTEVVERLPVSTGGPDFELTQALADQLGLSGRGTIKWRFAG
jgi:hypothetical protein